MAHPLQVDVESASAATVSMVLRGNAQHRKFHQDIFWRIWLYKSHSLTASLQIRRAKTLRSSSSRVVSQREYPSILLHHWKRSVYTLPVFMYGICWTVLKASGTKELQVQQSLKEKHGHRTVSSLSQPAAKGFWFKSLFVVVTARNIALVLVTCFSRCTSTRRYLDKGPRVSNSLCNTFAVTWNSEHNEYLMCQTRPPLIAQQGRTLSYKTQSWGVVNTKASLALRFFRKVIF